MSPQDPRQLPEPQQQLPASESMPFIPPQLDYSGSSVSTSIKRLYMKRVAIIACAVVLFFAGGAGIYALISGGNSKNIATNSETKNADGQYHGDGSDITDVKEATLSWECPEGTIKESGEGSSKECTVETVKTIDAKVQYSCPSGYTEIDGNDKVTCQKQIGGYTQTVNATASYSCPSGYTRSGTRCTHTDKKSATTVYYCDAGYSLSGTKCSKTYVVEGNVIATCPSGYTKSGHGTSATCTKTRTVRSDGTCPQGYKKVGKGKDAKCVRTVLPTFSCESGFHKTGSGRNVQCIKVKTSTVNAHSKLTCPSGYSLSGSTCTRTTIRTAAVNYSCSAGYVRSGSKCIRYIGGTISTVQATRKVSCPSGYKETGDLQCEKRVQEVKPAEETYKCDDGWELIQSVDTGQQCVLTK